MTARVCGGGGGVPSSLIEPKMGERGMGPLEAHEPRSPNIKK